jgi:hypothetical protein
LLAFRLREQKYFSKISAMTFKKYISVLCSHRKKCQKERIRQKTGVRAPSRNTEGTRGVHKKGIKEKIRRA